MTDPGDVVITGDGRFAVVFAADAWRIETFDADAAQLLRDTGLDAMSWERREDAICVLLVMTGSL